MSISVSNTPSHLRSSGLEDPALHRRCWGRAQSLPLFNPPLRVHPTLGASPPGWHHRAFPPPAGPEVQLRQDDLPQVGPLGGGVAALVGRAWSWGVPSPVALISVQVLCSPAPPRRQLPQEEVRPHQQPAPQKEGQIRPLHRLFLCPQGGLLPKPQGPGASIKFPFH